MTSDPSWTPFDPEEETLPGALSLPGGGGDSPMVVLLAGSPHEESGWAPLAALGVVRGWARSGHRVVLADLGLDAPALHALLGEENGEGITDALLYGSSVQRIARRPGGEKFALIPAGTPVSDPAGVLAHPRWGSLATGFREAGVILALYLPAALPGADALARRVSLRVLLGPGGEGLGRAPILARLRPAGPEPSLPILPDSEAVTTVTDEAAAPLTQEVSPAPIRSIPASRLVPAPVPALHRWAGEPVPSSVEGLLSADLPEDFSPGVGGAVSPAVRSSAGGLSGAGAGGDGADQESPAESVDLLGPPETIREDGVGATGPDPDPLDFLSLAPLLEAREVGEGWESPPDSGSTEFSLVDSPGLWTPLEAPSEVPSERTPSLDEGTQGVESPGVEEVAPPMEPVAPASVLPLTPGRPGTPVAPVPTPRTRAPTPAPAPRRRSPLGLLLVLLVLLLAVLGAARMGFLSIPGITPAADPGPGRAPGTSTAEAAVPSPGAVEQAPAGEDVAPGGVPATLPEAGTVEVAPSRPDVAPSATDVAPSSPRHTHALALNAYTTAAGARNAAGRLRQALPAHLVVVSPVEVSGRTFYRLLVAGATGPAAVAALRSEVAPAFPQGDPAEWIVREADRGFLLGEAASAAEARSRAAALEGKGVPTYVLEVTFPDGSRRWRVHAGAYGSDSEASALAALIREAGEGTPPLVPLAGRPPA